MLIIFFILHLHSKAIHNKDYSVVKTFGSPLVHNQGAFLCLNVKPKLIVLNKN